LKRSTKNRFSIKTSDNQCSRWSRFRSLSSINNR